MAPIDPLVALSRFTHSDRLHFYFEHRHSQRGIAAIDTTQLFQFNGHHRFWAAKQFIQTCLDHLIPSHFPHPPWHTARFFCSFTFFESSLDPNPLFPAATVFLPRWQLVRWGTQSAAIANVTVQPDSSLEALSQALWDELQEFRTLQTESFVDVSPALPAVWDMIDSHDFRSAVVSALRSIAQHQFDKLVLAHAIDVISPVALQWTQSLHQLRQRYPDCYVFSVGNGHQQFIGASPERLLSLHNRRLLTDALAGSAPRGHHPQADSLLAQQLLQSDKERREHQVVVDFLLQRLQGLNLFPNAPSAPSLLQLSTIQHLHTPIQTHLPATLHPLDILAELHPTPAVAGMPRSIACEQIRQYEGFERTLYAAPIGWIDAQENAEFVVGIRSALLDQHRARLYAGAGIVAGSDPDREQAEVRLKLQTMLQALV